MSNVIKIKRSETPGLVPSAGSLAVGELAINLADQKIYSKDSAGNVLGMSPSTGGGGGTGNSFTTIAVSGQSSVLADSTTDTLTLASEGVLGIRTNAGSDTITFTTNKSFPFTKYDGNASNIPLYTEASTLASSLDTVYLPFAKSDGSSVTTLKLTA